MSVIPCPGKPCIDDCLARILCTTRQDVDNPSVHGLACRSIDRVAPPFSSMSFGLPLLLLLLFCFWFGLYMEQNCWNFMNSLLVFLLHAGVIDP